MTESDLHAETRAGYAAAEKLPRRRLRTIAAFGLLPVLGLAGFAVTEQALAAGPHARSLPPTTGSTLGTPTVAVGTGLRIAGVDYEYGPAPSYEGASARTNPTSAPAQMMQRSEVYWGDANGRLMLRSGDTVTFDADYRVDLAGTDADPNQWAVIWQILGPNTDGKWPAPPLTLHISKGSWRIGGGAGYPGGSREAYAPTFPPFVNGVWVHWKIRVTLASAQSAAVVDAWLNGKQVVTAWHPPGATMYSTQNWLTAKSGLYLGGAHTALPPATRAFEMRGGSFAVTR